jgi:carbonic anhydrase/acetyltransferase-like protein (isoleucine patch superfamily)
MSRQAGYRSVSYLSSSAFVSPNISIGENTFVFENNTIQHLCQLEDNVILWSGNHVGHRSVIRKNCFISSHVVISGFCDIGDNCFVGVNSTIGNNLTIGKDCTIGAGSIITSDLLENSSIAPPKSPVRENISRRLWKVRDNGMD